MTNYPTGTVTFLFTGMEGSKKLAQEHPEAWETARAKHHAILREAIEANKGFVFQIIGDAFCADVSLSPGHFGCRLRLVCYEMSQLLTRKSI